MNFIQKRILTAIFAFIVAVNLIFFLPRLIPGTAAQLGAAGTKLPSQAVILLNQRFGLDQPLYVQYADYLKGIFLNFPPYFGFSYEFYPNDVTSLIASRITWSLLLIISSFALALLISYTLAAVSVMRRGGKSELGAVYSSILFTSTPPFWIAMILIWVFAVGLRLLPSVGYIDFNPGTGLSYVASVLKYAALPITTLTIIIFGNNYLILRGASQEVLKADFVSSAKARGLTQGSIARRYILKNSLLPMVSLLGYSVSRIISAMILVEAVFGYNGIGDLIVDAINSRDYPLMYGCFFVLTVIVLIGALIGDLLLLRLDPRLRR